MAGVLLTPMTCGLTTTLLFNLDVDSNDALVFTVNVIFYMMFFPAW